MGHVWLILIKDMDLKFEMAYTNMEAKNGKVINY